jgi:hypothetical protein
MGQTQEALVINLDHRTDRWERMQKDFSNSSFRLTRFPAIMITDPSISRKDRGYIGVARTHIEIIKMCKEKGQKTVLVLEDDCKLEPNWEENWYKAKDYLDTNLDKWEVFNGGICGIESLKRVVVIDNLYLLNTVGGCFCHFLYLNVDKVYDKLLTWEEHKKEIDLFYTFHFNHYTSYPLLAEQYNGMSDIGEREKNWSDNFILAKMDIRNNLLRMGFNVL